MNRIKSDEYIDLLKKYPFLGKNDELLFRLVLDPKVINNWQFNKQEQLQKNHLPTEWAEIGVVFNDPYNIIIRDLLALPDGSFESFTRSVSVSGLHGKQGVAILTELNGKLLLLHHFRHATRQWHFEIPRGYGEINIPTEDNVRKEISEEIGGEISNLIKLGEFFNNTGYEAIPVALYFAILSSVGNPNIGEGIDGYKWVTTDEIESMISQGIISDGFTIVAYTKAKFLKLL